MQIRPMRVVIGGVVGLHDTVGREFDREAVLAAIGRGSGALLTGDRRYGKTVLCRYVVDELRRSDVLAVEVSAERTSVGDFIDALAAALLKLDGRFATLGRAVTHVSEVQIAGTGFKVDLPPPSPMVNLDRLIGRAVEAAATNKLVIVIDEVTVLAGTLEKQGPGRGLEFLHLLRRLRQDNPGRLSMVLLGSIGFHHVSRDALTTTNDLETIPIRQISIPDAGYLAACLLFGEQVACENRGSVSQAIADSSEQIPYYVQHLVRSARRWTKDHGRPIAASNIAGLVADALSDQDDPWNLKHYHERIPGYYGVDADLAAAILDAYAAQVITISIDAVLHQLGSIPLPSRPTRSQVVDLIERLEADHYLRRYGRDDRFASDLIRRAWLAYRR